MPYINHSTREISFKVVYYGPGLCGKTTNLQYIYNKTPLGHKGKLVAIDTEDERTLFFDFLPLSLGEIRGFKVRLHLYTVPGQPFYTASRKLIIRGLDGIIFIADSQIERMDANIESLKELNANLSALGYELKKIPFILQYNKRDLQDIAPVEMINSLLNTGGAQWFEAIATKGEGVFDTLKNMLRHLLRDLKSHL